MGRRLALLKACVAMGELSVLMVVPMAMKKLWQNKRKAEGKPYDKPNMVMNSAVQVCWEVSVWIFCSCATIASQEMLTTHRKRADTSTLKKNTYTAQLIAMSSIPRNA